MGNPQKLYSVNSLCEVELISRGYLYEAWKNGGGPRFFYHGNRRRITEEARQEWHRELEAEAAASNGATTNDTDEAAA